MVREHQQELQKQLWNIAKTLRGNMSADDFRDYILGLIFYKYLSDKLNRYCDGLLAEDGITFSGKNSAESDDELIKELHDECVDNLGYFIAPKQLFSSLAKRGEKSEFILDELSRVLNDIEQSTTSADSADDFNGLFEELDLNSSKLGKNPDARNKLICQVLVHLENIDFQIDNTEIDLLGDAYEYLIGQFASGAGKKAGEFYTPQQVSKILAKLVSLDGNVKSVYDPTCGSGSLLLRVAKEVSSTNLEFCGQEQNPSTFNLARMNMLMHGVRYDKFDIKNDDTLEHPMHTDKRFDAVVANPPFSVKWSANELLLNDERFADYGKLAPKSKADFAFILHMIHQLNEEGRLAVVVPHGVLYRGASEGHIRKHLIENKNYLDTVIGLPSGIFFGTNIPTCILLFKKNRTNLKDVLFINAGKYYAKGKPQNYLRDTDVNRVIETVKKRENVEHFSHVAPISEIAKNAFNLNISRYVDDFEQKPSANIANVTAQLNKLDTSFIEIDNKLKMYTDELGIPFPKGGNLSLLKSYMHSITQQLFDMKWLEQNELLTFTPPALRFKSKNGSNYPDWKLKKFKDCFTFHVTNSLPREKLSYNIGKVKNIHYGDIHTKFPPVFKIEHEHVPFISNDDDIKKIKSGSYCQNGDIIFADASEDYNDIGKSIEVQELGENKLVAGLHTHLARPKEKFAVGFQAYLQKSWFFRYQIMRIAQGSKVLGLSTTHLSTVDMPIPSFEEQAKIADFLSMVEKKIMLIEAENERINEWL